MGWNKPLKTDIRLDVSDTKLKCHYGRYVWCVMMVLGLSLYFIDLIFEGCFADYFHRGYAHLFVVSDRPLSVSSSRFVVDTPGCRIPAMDPFDPLIKKFIKKVEPIDCAARSAPQLVKSNLTSLYVVHAALAHYNVSDIGQLECCYRPFWRVDGDINNYSRGVDDQISIPENEPTVVIRTNYAPPCSPNEELKMYETNCTTFQTEARLDNEFVKVECQINGTEIYTDYHAFTPLKKNTTTQFEKATESIPTKEDDFLSVLVIGIDAVSRLNFHRQMPLTEEFLREMEAVEMLGYNKVADNTFPNLVPVLSGLSEEELRNTCWKNNKVSFDSCPWLWKNYSAAGYSTAFGEDAPWMGIFSYLKVGFVKQPTDYYMRPYSKTYEDNAGHTKRMNANLCIGPCLNLEILLQYASKFAQTMATKRSFGLFWGTSLSHDDLNYPQLGDALHASILRQLVTNGALNRTLLIVMSDHGLRWGSIRETYHGRLEERLPLIFFMFPAWFKEKYSGAITNLRRNANRLTTPFDLHATLVDLLNPSNLQRESLRSRISKQDIDSPPRGVSLFLPVSKNRTCTEAGIVAHWCTCHQSQPLAPDSAIAKKMALVLVKHVNHMLKPYRACAGLRLLAVRDARVQFPLEHLSQDTKHGVLKDYDLIVQTSPGDALFEATVRHSMTKVASVMGMVSRINTYGNQSSCVDDFLMKLYCYCDIFSHS